jgi:hypothetical protein
MRKLEEEQKVIFFSRFFSFCSHSLVSATSARKSFGETEGKGKGIGDDGCRDEPQKSGANRRVQSQEEKEAQTSEQHLFDVEANGLERKREKTQDGFCSQCTTGQCTFMSGTNRSVKGCSFNHDPEWRGETS